MATDSFADILNDPEDDVLRSKYYDMLSTGLSKPDIAPNGMNLAIQGGLPALAAIILGGKEGFAASAEPLKNVYDQESTRAQNQAKFDMDLNLKKAGIVGEEIGRREKQKIDAFEKNRAWQLQKENLEEKKDSRREANEDRDLTRQQNLVLGQGMQDLRKDALEASAESKAAAQSMREETLNIQKTRLQNAQMERISKAYAAQSKTIVEKKGMLDQARRAIALGTPESYAQVAPALAIIGGERGGKLSDQDIKRQVPENLRTAAIQWHNWLTGDRTNPMPKNQGAALLKLIDVYEEGVNEKFQNIRNGIAKKFKGTSLTSALDPAEVDDHIDSLGMEDGFTLSQAQQEVAGMDPDKTKELARANLQRKQEAARLAPTAAMGAIR